MNYIYHYTSLTNLVSLLSSERLLLIRYDKFLALYYPELYPVNNDFLLNRYKDIFVSSWTKNSKESLVLWKQFGGYKETVRIGINTDSVFIDGKIEIENYFTKAFFSSQFFLLKSGEKMVYLEELEYLPLPEIQKIISFNDDYDLPREEWLKIVELRNRLEFFNMDTQKPIEEIRLSFRVPERLIQYSSKNKRDYERASKNDDDIIAVFVKLPPKFFNSATFLLAPEFSDENRILLQSLLDNKGIRTTAVKSKLDTPNSLFYKFPKMKFE